MRRVVIRRNMQSGAAITGVALRVAKARVNGAPSGGRRVRYKPPPDPAACRDHVDHCEHISYLAYVLTAYPTLAACLTEWEEEFIESISAVVMGRRLSAGQLRIVRDLISKVTDGRIFWEEFIAARAARRPTYTWIGPPELEQVSITMEGVDYE